MSQRTSKCSCGRWTGLPQPGAGKSLPWLAHPRRGPYKWGRRGWAGATDRATCWSGRTRMMVEVVPMGGREWRVRIGQIPQRGEIRPVATLIVRGKRRDEARRLAKTEACAALRGEE